MNVALVSRTIVLAGWLLADLWHGVREPVGIVAAIALLTVWAVALVRDRRRAATPRGAQRPA